MTDVCGPAIQTIPGRRRLPVVVLKDQKSELIMTEQKLQKKHNANDMMIGTSLVAFLFFFL